MAQASILKIVHFTCLKGIEKGGISQVGKVSTKGQRMRSASPQTSANEKKNQKM